MDIRYEKVRGAVDAAHQAHVLEHWDTLTVAEKEQLLQELEGLDFPYLSRVFSASVAAAAAPGGYEGVEPVRDVVRLKDATPAQRAEWAAHGYRLIAEGRVAVLLLAGGQGTRLGSSAPKGCYDIGLPSHKSLFQLQAERLLRLQRLAAAAVAPAPARPLAWYVMTSPFTHEATLAHFRDKSFFGLDPAQVHFFQQGFLPAFTEEGKLILDSPTSLAKAPDGNGGVYLALARSGALAALAEAGVEALDVYCVDNALALPARPDWLGYCHGVAKAEVGARVVAKAYPEEKVGVFALRRQPASATSPAPSPALSVLEYSELPPHLASAADPATGALHFNASNICMHYLALPWLQRVAAALAAGRGPPYHVARKAIPSWRAGAAAEGAEGASVRVPGVKLELFIFDPFHEAGERVALVEVDRSEEFAPVKNAPGSATDSPDTARAAALALHARWVAAAGGKVVAGAAAAAAGVEVSPLVSYGGEGLEPLVAGRVYDSVWAEELQRPAAAAPAGAQ